MKKTPLHQLGEFSRGTPFTKKDLTDHGGAAITYGQITHLAPIATTAPARLPEHTWNATRKAMPGDLLIADTAMDIDGVGAAAAWAGDGPVAVDSQTIIFRTDIDAGLLAQILATSDVARQKRRFITGVTAKRITVEHLGRIEVPVPEPDDGAEVFEKLRRLLAFKEEGTAQFRAYSEGRIRQLRFYRNEVLRFRERSGLTQDPTNYRTA